MRPLPEKGLIVSCYLKTMKGCEKEFIASVAHIPGVVALRVEGLENIRYARRIAPEKFIIGLIKRIAGRHTLITPEREDGYAIHDAGADMVATSFLYLWLRAYPDIYCPSGFSFGYRIMWDLSEAAFNQLPRYNKFMLNSIKKEFECKNLIFATTYEDLGFELMRQVKAEFPDAIVNFEGGVKRAFHVKQAFELGADYVTIGKAINDPAFITRYFLKEINEGA